jgi:hypothetical protein
MLPTRTCKIRCLGIKNTNRCESHEKGNHLPSLCMLHHTRYTSLFMFYTIVGECKLFNTHSPHFTFQSIFLKVHLLMQTKQLCDWIHYLTKHIIMEAWVKIVDSILHHQKWIPKMKFKCLFYTPWHIFCTSLCTFLCKVWHITWRLLTISSSISPYTPSSYDHIPLLHTLNVHL